MTGTGRGTINSPRNCVPVVTTRPPYKGILTCRGRYYAATKARNVRINIARPLFDRTIEPHPPQARAPIFVNITYFMCT